LQSSQRSKYQALKFCALLTLGMLSPVVLLQLIFSPPGIYTLWDWANAMGYLAAAISLFLFVYKGRARAFPAYSGRFFANLHRDLGYIVALLLLGHVGLLLLLEPHLLEHLKPTAPLHMSAGLLALVLFLALVVTSIPVLRRKLWSNYHIFRHTHLVVAVAAFALLAYHIWASGFYLDNVWKMAVFASVITLVLLFYVLSSQAKPAETVFRLRNSAGYSHLIAYSCAGVALFVSLAVAILNNLA
jgi:DMSO/TMAO reductase YedYZ heme-binding membrane subunit